MVDMFNEIYEKILREKDSGVIQIGDDYELDSLAKLDVILYLDDLKNDFLDKNITELSEAFSLKQIVVIYEK